MNNAADTSPATMARTSDTETTLRRSFDAPARLLYAAWTKPDLFAEWWVPKSFGMTLLSCDMDVRTGGTYRLVFQHPAFDQPMAFFGSYTDVIPNARIVWSNEESDEGAITTVTFAEKDDKTTVTVHDLYPTKTALDAQIASGATGGMDETMRQLDQFLLTMTAP